MPDQPSSLFWNACAAEEELYQYYQEKALHNDSDEDAEAREPKPDKDIVVQYRPIRTSWSQLSVVRRSSPTFLTFLTASLASILCRRSLGMLAL